MKCNTLTTLLQLDETDTKNESFICFRRREIKAVRKTRAQQATYGDKMQRLQSEMLNAIDVARLVIQREALKKEAAAHGQIQADARFKFVDLKRKFPGLGVKEDEELFYDKERTKKPKLETSGFVFSSFPYGYFLTWIQARSTQGEDGQRRVLAHASRAAHASAGSTGDAPEADRGRDGETKGEGPSLGGCRRRESPSRTLPSLY